MMLYDEENVFFATIYEKLPFSRVEVSKKGENLLKNIKIILKDEIKITIQNHCRHDDDDDDLKNE